MSWKTRHMRKRKGKGKRTKRILRGGASESTMKNVIAYLVEKKEEVSATIGKEKTRVKIAFLSDRKFKCVSDGIFKDKEFPFTLGGAILAINANIIISKNNSSNSLNIANKEITLDNLKELETTSSLFYKNKKIQQTADTTIQTNNDKQERDLAVVANNTALAQAVIKDAYVVSIIDLQDVMKPDVVVEQSFQKTPYTEHALKHLFNCVETYLMDSITKDKIKEFLKSFKESSPSEKTPTITQKDASKQIQLAIDTISQKMLGFMSTEKGPLIEMLQKLSAVKIEPSNMYSIDKKCELDKKRPDYNICFFINCINYYDLGGDELNSITTIEDIIKTGTVSGYNKLAYVSDQTADESYLGCVCYNDNQPELKISKILENAKNTSEHKGEISKLTGLLSPIIKGNYKTMILPSSLDDKVDTKVFQKQINNDGEFTTWELIPTVENTTPENGDTSRFDSMKNNTDGEFKTLLSDLTVMFVEPDVVVPEVAVPAGSNDAVSEVALPDVALPDVALPAVSNDAVSEVAGSNDAVSESASNQIGGAGRTYIDLQKHPELQSVNEMFESLPETIYIANEALINETINKINASDATPDISSLQPTVEMIRRNSNIIKEVANTDIMKQLRPEESIVAAVEETPAVSEETPAVEEEGVKEETPAVEETPVVEEEGVKEEAPAVEEEGVKEETPAVETPAVEETPVVSEEGVKEETPAVEEASPVNKEGAKEESSEVVKDEVPKPDKPLTLDDLKMSPVMTNKSTNELGQYVFVPKLMVQQVIDYLLSNGCEITTIDLKK